MKRLKLVAVLLLAVLLFCACQAPSANNTNFAQDKIEVYYIDVGQADSTLVLCEGVSLLIDGGNVEDADDVISFIKQKGVTTLNMVIASHAHEDHVGGLANILKEFDVGAVLSPVATYSSACFNDFKEIASKKGSFTVCNNNYSFSIGSAIGKILWPIGEAESNTNNTSVVVKLCYKDVSFLFTGDIESDAESKLISTDADLSANVLKVAHHGSDSSSSYSFLRSVLPQYAIISCGKNNVYNHPHKQTLDILLQAEITTYRTDEVGTIYVSSDGKNITVMANNISQTTKATIGAPALESAITFIGNKNSKKFHLPDCSSLPKEENRVYFSSRNSAINEGFMPCSVCKA